MPELAAQPRLALRRVAWQFALEWRPAETLRRGGRDPIVEVAAAICVARRGPGVLLASAGGQVYAGYWNSPRQGRTGETVRAALTVNCRRNRHHRHRLLTLATRQFTFRMPRSPIWRVTAWDGEIGITAPLEHAAVEWQECGRAASVTPILPANDPILKALSLPTTMAITMAESEGAERQLARLENALQNGLRLIQIRDKGWPPTQRLAFAEAVVRLAHAHGALVLINDDEEIARRVGADGLHLSAARLAKTTQRPDFAWLGASCHSATEITRAGELGCDYALLGPVMPTPTHPESGGLGWVEFARHLAGNTLPVFALGGMKTEMLAEAQQHGAHGLALMRGW